MKIVTDYIVYIINIYRLNNIHIILTLIKKYFVRRVGYVWITFVRWGGGVVGSPIYISCVCLLCVSADTVH